MKKLVFFCLVVLTACATLTRPPSLQEDELILTRKYVGNFVEYRPYLPEKFGDPYLIWIKTTMDSTYGKIAAYSQKCEFNNGDRLYIRRVYYAPGMASGYWDYQIESSDSRIYYRLSEFQHDSKEFIESWFTSQSEK
ncbi:MAG: hypothetical protein IQL11_08270 [Bacteroidales bacterium]|nr:hypothetical protein [Bacteroidales bacterium]